MKEIRPSFQILAAGDLLVLALMTLIGFQMHETLGSGHYRFLATFLPFAACWFAVGFPMQVFDPTLAGEPRQLWRPFWAMIAAAPLAALLRALLLNTVVIPMFVIAFGGLCALSLLAWRAVVALTAARTLRKSGANG